MIKTIGTVLVGVITFCLLLFLTCLMVGYPVMWLWNFVMPAIFGLPAMTFWQAFALYFLIRLLFFVNVNSSKS